MEHVFGDLGVAEVGEQVDREPHEPDLVDVSDATAEPVHEDVPPLLGKLSAVQRQALVDLLDGDVHGFLVSCGHKQKSTPVTRSSAARSRC